MKRIHSIYYLIYIFIYLVVASPLKAQVALPPNYYSQTNGLSGENLKAALNDIIQDHTVYTYTTSGTDTWDILKLSDADPTDAAQVVLVYAGRSVDGAQEYNSGNGWSREHVWPKSRGDFNTNRGIGTDVHNLKPTSLSCNSARSNRWFHYGENYYYESGTNTYCKTSSSTRNVWEPRDEEKGDIARILFYMVTRYEGEDGELDLELLNYFPDENNEPTMAMLATLMAWHEADPPDAFEIRRNDVIYQYQNNRNPFIDNPDFAKDIWGEYNVASIPNEYYAPAANKEGNDLKTALNNIISSHTEYTYASSSTTDTWDILKLSDADVTNPDDVVLVYSDRSVNGPQEYNSGNGWTREHVWPQSRGDFNTNLGIGTDLHNLKPADNSVNSARSNRWFDYADDQYYDNVYGAYIDSKTSSERFVWEPHDGVKGDIARIIFYMMTRYEGKDGELDLELEDYLPDDDTDKPLMSKLSTLLEWHRNDPPDDYEIRRNNIIYSYQNNRNPFIDHPEYVDNIFAESGVYDTNPVAVSSDQNYIRTITPLVPLSASELSQIQDQTNAITMGKISTTVAYYDGLGRLSQTVNIKASPSGYDIVQPIVYDALGRQAEQHLPYVASDDLGTCRGWAANACIDYYTNELSDDKPYTITSFDNSPLNRVESVMGVGSNWHEGEKDVKYSYSTNSTAITSWKSDKSSFDYPARSLYITTTTDEDGHVSSEYKDMQGRTVIKENELRDIDTPSTINILRTHYVYDDFGLLVIVVPPGATPTKTELCYFYDYDARRRMIAKKIPGADTVYMVYDHYDRLVLTQDGNMRDASPISDQYNFTKYDALNRPVMTGIMTTHHNLSTIRAAFDDIGTLGNENYQRYESYESTHTTTYGYSMDNSYPDICHDTLEIHTVTWYDNDDFVNDLYSSAGLEFSSDAMPDGYEQSHSTKTKGMVTGTMTKLLNNEASSYTASVSDPVTVNYYDDDGNVIQTIAQNHKGGTDIYATRYAPISFQVLATQQLHKRQSADEAIALAREFDYDHAGRLTVTYSTVGNGERVKLSSLTYNERSELITKALHQKEGMTDFAQVIDYNYNIKGWLTDINDPDNLGDDLWGMKLYYDDISSFNNGITLATGDTRTTGYYNGNIAATKWKHQDDLLKDAYKYEYDDLNRLNEAISYWGIDYSAYSDLDNNPYNVSVRYDQRGNIVSLDRFNSDYASDILTYNYKPNSNQINDIDARPLRQGEELSYISNSTNPYSYDVNGNMTFDPAKNTNISYNKLNLPLNVAFSNLGVISYHYNAAGAKVAQQIESSDNSTFKTTEYLGNFIYENGVLTSILHEEGRIIPTGSNFYYEYALKDHLGNSRAVFASIDGSVDQLQKSDYYPFGLAYNQQNYQTILQDYKENPYLYNGKEMQDEGFGGIELGWLDYGFRMYDASIARWNGVDLLAEKYISHSPYVYVANNPLKFIDPDGMQIQSPKVFNSTHTDEDGNVIAVEKDGDLGVYRHKGNKEEAEKHFKENYSLSNKSAGGEYMGRTLKWDSFDKVGGVYGRIYFGSYEAQEWLDWFERSMNLGLVTMSPISLRVGYGFSASTFGYYDYKTKGLSSRKKDSNFYNHIKRGSQISEGVYVSARDVGNYAAGMVARMTNQRLLHFQIQAGAFQLAGNKVLKIPGALREAIKNGEDRYYGEEEISFFFQKQGYLGNNK